VKKKKTLDCSKEKMVGKAKKSTHGKKAGAKALAKRRSAKAPAPKRVEIDENEKIIDDWLFVKDSNFIKEYWRKNKKIFKRHARELDHRMRLEDAVSLAAEIGEVDILEQLLDHMKSDKEIGDDAQKKIEEFLSGNDSGNVGMFGKTPLHKAAYRGKYDMVRLLLKLGSSPNTVGVEGQEGDITPIDACIFGCSITPPEYGRNVTSALDWLEYFKDHFRNI